MRHIVPNGDVAAIFDRALSLLLEDLEQKRVGATEHPRSGRTARHDSRHIPASVKREVWKRDRGRCAYAGSRGRCTETGFLEFHHVEPYAAGGRGDVGNIELRCRANNSYEAALFFGESQPSIVREARGLWKLVPGPVLLASDGPLQFAAESAVLEGGEEGVEFLQRRTLPGSESLRSGRHCHESILL